MLSKTQEILTKFREINRNSFYESAKDFKPIGRLGEGSYYGDFDEVEEIYNSMYSLVLQLDQQIFYGYYENAYSNPLEPISSIQELNEYVKSHVSRLQEINKKHNNQLIPVILTLENYLKTMKMLDYVMGLNEIKSELQDTSKLKSELIQLKAEIGYKKRRRRVLHLFTFYLFFLIIPAFGIIYFWSSQYQAKWFQLGLFLFPIISFLYDKDSFFEMIKFIFFNNYRVTLKNTLLNEIENTYKNEHLIEANDKNDVNETKLHDKDIFKSGEEIISEDDLNDILETLGTEHKTSFEYIKGLKMFLRFFNKPSSTFLIKDVENKKKELSKELSKLESFIGENFFSSEKDANIFFLQPEFHPDRASKYTSKNNYQENELEYSKYDKRLGELIDSCEEAYKKYRHIIKEKLRI